VAAVRRGTITTAKPLSQEALEAEFIPESEWGRIKDDLVRSAPVILIFLAASSVWAYFTRKKPVLVLAIGVIWLVLSGIFFSIRSDKTIGFGFLASGAVCLIWGICSLVAARRTAAAQDQNTGILKESR
jgi:drug/metabolite transporter superfamily protein YnfA